MPNKFLMQSPNFLTFFFSAQLLIVELYERINVSLYNAIELSWSPKEKLFWQQTIQMLNLLCVFSRL